MIYARTPKRTRVHDNDTNMTKSGDVGLNMNIIDSVASSYKLCVIHSASLLSTDTFHTLETVS